MGAHENRAALALQRLDHIADLGHASRIQARCGLVEDEEFGLVEERLRDCEALLHPLRELLDPVVRPLVQLDHLQDGLAAVFDFLGRHASEASRIRERFDRREVAIELRRLNDRADARKSVGRLLANIDAEQRGPTSGGPDQVRHDLDRRGLSGAIRTEEAERRARRDGQVERLQGGEVTVLLAEALQVDRNFVGHRFRAFLRLHENRDISRYT